MRKHPPAGMMPALHTMTTDKKKQPAIFLDRDGTLVEEVDFLHRVEDLRFFDFTDEAVMLLKENGYLIVVVTNQSGIGRNIYDEAAMHGIHEKIQAELTHELDAFYFCPHLPDAGCACRKPGVGMIEKALAKFDIDVELSWMIGDKAIDVQAGKNAGMKTALVLTGYGEKELEKLEQIPDLIAENLLDAVKEIITEHID
jgi:D-glycero-D-manno-heptose 1,7-bisphosphate phosphatase